jgi:protein-S-isoprenylcysteine O-methyltransferase Ste14
LTQDRYKSLREFLARATICGLFTLLSANILIGFLKTGRVTGLLLLASEFLVVALTFARRPAALVDRSAGATIVTFVSTVGPLLLRASDETPVLPDGATAGLTALGLIVVVVGKMTLGRSFGLVPANRGVVIAGPYAFVRHPIYTGYLITHVAFLLAHPRVWNIALVVIADTALIVRALVEERVLDHDAGYRAYCQRVGWHFVPGVF